MVSPPALMDKRCRQRSPEVALSNIGLLLMYVSFRNCLMQAESSGVGRRWPVSSGASAMPPTGAFWLSGRPTATRAEGRFGVRFGHDGLLSM